MAGWITSLAVTFNGVLQGSPMLDAMMGFAQQCRDGIVIGRAFGPPEVQPRAVVISGLGGSAIGGDLLRAYASPMSRVPIVVNRDYDLPAFVGRDTLFLAASYSGNTEETLAACHQAIERGATVFGYTTGGVLGQELTAAGRPVCMLPPGLQPRAALGYSFFTLLATLESLELIPAQAMAVEDTLDQIEAATEAYCPDGAVGRNRARELAEFLESRIPVILGSWGPVGVVAYRWKSQVNENAKGVALHNVYPELTHNETVAWSGVPELNRSFGVVMLRTPSDPRRIHLQMDLSRSIFEAQAPLQEVMGTGHTLLGQMFSLICLGDWMSLYLAQRRGQDPTPVEVITRMKQAMAKGE